MYKKIPLFLALLLSTCCYIFGQNTSPVTLHDLAGEWKADMEKSFSRAERRKMTDYRVLISESNGTLNIRWEFLKDGKPTSLQDTYIIDGKEHDFYNGPFESVRAYVGSIKGNTVKIKYIRNLFEEDSKLLDSRTFKLSPDKKILTVETLRRSAKVGEHFNSDTKRLVLVRQI